MSNLETPIFREKNKSTVRNFSYKILATVAILVSPCLANGQTVPGQEIIKTEQTDSILVAKTFADLEKKYQQQKKNNRLQPTR